MSREMEVAREVTSQLRFTEVNIDAIQQKYGVTLDSVFGDLIDALVAWAIWNASARACA